jgi:hypothetical protein
MNVHLAKQVVCYYMITITILGTIGNCISCFICLRPSLRKINTFKIFASIAIVDTFGLYEWNIYQIALYLYGIDLYYVSIWACKLLNYFQYVTFETSAWLLVSAVLDRLLSVKFPIWARKHFSSRRCSIFIISLFFFFLIFNIPFAIKNGYTYLDENQTEHIQCHYSPIKDPSFLQAWSWVFMYFEFFLIS